MAALDSEIDGGNETMDLILLSDLEIMSLKVADLKAALAVRKVVVPPKANKQALQQFLKLHEAGRRDSADEEAPEGDDTLAAAAILAAKNLASAAAITAEAELLVAQRQVAEERRLASSRPPDRMTSFQNFVTKDTYDPVIGHEYAQGNHGPNSPFQYHQEAGMGMLIKQFAFDLIRPKHAIPVLKGSGWEHSQMSAIYTVVRVRLVDGLREVDAKLCINLTEAPLPPGIVMKETLELWGLYLLTPYGLDHLQTWVSGVTHRDTDVLVPTLVPAVEMQEESIAPVPNVQLLTSQRELDAISAKKAVRDIFAAITVGDPIFANLLTAAMAAGPITIGTTPKGNLLHRMLIQVQLTESSAPVITNHDLLWCVLTARHSVSLGLSTNGKEGVSLSDFSDSPEANTESANGLACLWDSVLRIYKRLSGQFFGQHHLQPPISAFAASLRNTTTEPGALGSFPLAFLCELNAKKWLQFGLAAEDHARLRDRTAYAAALQDLFHIDSDKLESDLTRWRRAAGHKRQQVDQLAKSAKAKLNGSTPSQAVTMGGGSGRGGGNSRGSGGGGTRGGGGRAGRHGAGGQGGAPTNINNAAQFVPSLVPCMANLQSILVQSGGCNKPAGTCTYSHDPITSFDREATKLLAARVVTNQGRLSTLMAKLNDKSLKFKGE